MKKLNIIVSYTSPSGASKVKTFEDVAIYSVTKARFLVTVNESADYTETYSMDSELIDSVTFQKVVVGEN